MKIKIYLNERKIHMNHFHGNDDFNDGFNINYHNGLNIRYIYSFVSKCLMITNINFNDGIDLKIHQFIFYYDQTSKEPKKCKIETYFNDKLISGQHIDMKDGNYHYKVEKLIESYL